LKNKIYINGRFLTQNLGGVQRFAYEISKNFVDISKKEVVVLIPKSQSILKCYKYKFVLHEIGFNKGHFWEQFDLVNFLKKNGNPLLINLTNSCPIFYSNQISTIHDLSIYNKKNWHSFLYKLFYKMIIPKMIRCSHKILTVSEFSKKEIINKFNLLDDDVKVINNAISLSKTGNKNIKSDSYILFVGASSSRKNLFNAIEAFNKIKDRNVRFKIVGLANRYRRLIENNKKIDVYNQINDNELSSLYLNAELLIFPSFYEGFGIPPIEAMYFGCPVIVSNLEVFKELYQKAAIYIDPHNVDQMKNSMIEILDNKSLRKDLINEGFIQSEKFSWKKSSKSLIDTINKL